MIRNAEQRASWWGYLSLGWMTPLIDLGNRNYLEEADIEAIRSDYRTAALAEQLSAVRARFPWRTLNWCIKRAFWTTFLTAGVAKCLVDLLGFAVPAFLSLFIRVITDLSKARSNSTVSDNIASLRNQAYIYAACMFASIVLQVVCNNVFQRNSLMMGLKARAALIGLLYRRLLLTSAASTMSSTASNINGMVSLHCTHIDFAYQYYHHWWSCLLSMAGAIVWLWFQLGPASFAGSGLILVLFIPVQGSLIGRLGRARGKANAITAQRVTLLEEIVQGIKAIKLYAIETWVAERMAGLRRLEVHQVRSLTWIRSISVSLNMLGVSLATFAAYMVLAALKDGRLEATTVFSSMILFNMLRYPTIMLPIVWAMVRTAELSTGILDGFLLRSPPPPPPGEPGEPVQPIKPREPAGTGNEDAGDPFVVHGMSYAWPSSSPTPTPTAVLHNVSLTVPRGSLTMVAGPVGSGKSTLLSALMGQCPGIVPLAGHHHHCRLPPRSAYCAQQPWIQNATVEDNIVVFGQENHVCDPATVRKQYYEHVLDVCQLRSDLALLPQSDQTEIGERGATLSGGQRHRVALARAAFSCSCLDADCARLQETRHCPLVILDDPLSAVDVHVGNAIMAQCITGLMGRCTVVLVTHQVQHLRYADQIVQLKRGRVAWCGSFAEMPSSSDSTTTMPHHQPRPGLTDDDHAGDKADPYKDEDEEEEDEMSEPSVVMWWGGQAEVSRSQRPSRRAAPRQPPGATVQAATRLLTPVIGTTPHRQASLTLSENVNQGGLGWQTLWYYGKAFGAVATVAWLVLNLAFIGVRFYSDRWLADWTDQVWPDQDRCMWVFGILAAVQTVLVFGANVVSGERSLRAATELHDTPFRRLLAAPMSFFDTTPVGRIMNRFTKDQEVLDHVMMDSTRLVVYFFLCGFGSLVVVAVYFYWVALGFVPVLALYWYVQQRYRRVSRELKRFDSNTRSPILALCTETASGLATIQAFHGLATQGQGSASFAARLDAAVDNNNRFYYASQCSTRWLGGRLELLGASVVGITLLVCILTLDLASSSLSAGLVGLSLVYAISVTSTVTFLLQKVVETENNLNSVERTRFYLDHVHPEPLRCGSWQRAHQPGWLTATEAGTTVEFRGYSARYHPSLPFVLRDINLVLRPGERLGIVGQTGSGKSSMISALFGMLGLPTPTSDADPDNPWTQIDNQEGAILVGGCDIRQMAFQQLRSSIAIISQESFLFSGTLRDNVDPYHRFTDSQVVNALYQMQFQPARMMAGNNHEEHMLLTMSVQRGGTNFSIGQRSQIHLARILLQKAKLLIMDEATANIDYATDTQIQQQLRSSFPGVTMMIVAHRLHTIMDVDRVLVLRDGRVAELDSPSALLAAQPPSMFARMVHESQSPALS